MAVNALDPSKPTLLSESIELTAELRAIKQRLVTDKQNIESLQNTLVNISGITAFGAELLASVDSDAALDVLDFTAIGKELTQLANYEDLAALLGVESPVPELSIGTGKWCLTFAGGYKLNIIKANVSSGGSSFTWQVPFTTSVYAVLTTLNANADFDIWVGDYDNAGVDVDHNNGSDKVGFILGIGQ
jgi:hypothetical protein